MKNEQFQRREHLVLENLYRDSFYHSIIYIMKVISSPRFENFYQSLVYYGSNLVNSHNFFWLRRNWYFSTKNLEIKMTEIFINILYFVHCYNWKSQDRKYKQESKNLLLHCIFLTNINFKIFNFFLRFLYNHSVWSAIW